MKVKRLRLGYCPICKKLTFFLARYDWLRDHYLCIRCNSIPRYRALIETLETYFTNWREMHIHESSPCGAASDYIAKECKNYVPSFFFPEIAPGNTKSGYRCENLEQQTFDDGVFDLVVTQDVLEHVFHPEKAFREIARTLKRGGAHVFTVPWYYWQKTVVRSRQVGDHIEYLLPPEYHGNPISPDGSLVVREWGYDIGQFIEHHSGMFTQAIYIHSPFKGIEGKFLEVFVARKSE